MFSHLNDFVLRPVYNQDISTTRSCI